MKLQQSVVLIAWQSWQSNGDLGIRVQLPIVQHGTLKWHVQLNICHMHSQRTSARANFQGGSGIQGSKLHAAEMNGMWSGSRVCPGCGHNLRSMALRSGRRPLQGPGSRFQKVDNHAFLPPGNVNVPETCHSKGWTWQLTLYSPLPVTTQIHGTLRNTIGCTCLR